MGRSHGSQWGWVRGWWRFPGRPSMTLGELLWVSTASTFHTLTVHETIPGQMRWMELEVLRWMPPRRCSRRRRRRRKGTLSRNLGHVRTALSNGSERPKYQKHWSVITWFFNNELPHGNDVNISGHTETIQRWEGTIQGEKVDPSFWSKIFLGDHYYDSWFIWNTTSILCFL